MIPGTSGKMTELREKRNGLEGRIANWTSRTGFAISVRDDLGHLNLRGDPDSPGFLAAAEKVLGQPLPQASNTISDGDFTIFWLGPDEWLILAPAENTARLAGQLESSLSGQHAATNNVSGGQIALALTGERVREVLARGCTLDFHPQTFKKGRCAQSGLARANVAIGAMGGDDEFLVIVRRSFADYLIAWLDDVA
jgi:sarcosine oxidase subunit gamma